MPVISLFYNMFARSFKKKTVSDETSQSWISTENGTICNLIKKIFNKKFTSSGPLFITNIKNVFLLKNQMIWNLVINKTKFKSNISPK